MKPIVLFRNLGFGDEEAEVKAASKYFPTTLNRAAIPAGSLVVGRYSVLPFYKELETDLALNGSKLINSYSDHRFVADLDWWTKVVEETPKTWGRLEDLPEIGPFVLKGETNSKKHLWNTHMYAETKKDAIEVYIRLSEDSLIGSQQIYIRQYVPLKRLATGLNGLPITKEFRVFVCHQQIISKAFYWSNFADDVDIPSVDEIPEEFLKRVISSIGDMCAFYAIDVAQTELGNWIVIEINDGQMSGISENDPETLYGNLYKVLSGGVMEK